jgi:hypothetical protein
MQQMLKAKSDIESANKQNQSQTSELQSLKSQKEQLSANLTAQMKDAQAKLAAKQTELD